MTDWIMIAITAVYVIATIFICIFNYRSAKATREQLAESKRQFEENNRAFVTVTFETIRGSLLVLNIHNHGHQVANNVSVKINPEFIANVPDKEYLVKLCESSFTLGVDKSWFINGKMNRVSMLFGTQVLTCWLKLCRSFIRVFSSVLVRLLKTVSTMTLIRERLSSKSLICLQLRQKWLNWLQGKKLWFAGISQKTML